jgi:shikimate kinase / 3-dehydroquinate synthase
MGAGKSTLGLEAASRLSLPFVDVDDEIERRVGRISEFFDRYGEEGFRELERTTIEATLAAAPPQVVAVGGGALATPEVRALLRERAITVLLEVDVETAWKRSRGGNRPLARDEGAFRELYEERAPAYQEAADATARDVDDVVLAAGSVHTGVGALEQLGELVPGTAAAALVSDAHVSGIYGAEAQLALGGRLASTHNLPVGEEAKAIAACQALWRELRLDRGGVLVALGGGCVTDPAGFVAATYLRGVDWVAVPTTLVGQVDAAIGGKTGIDLPEGKNLVGAFHWPARVVVDPALLGTLPEAERRAGLAEVVKTGLLAGEPFWELPDPELVRRCAAFKTAVCLRDPHESGERAILNLGHTFAHALEAGSGYRVSHGDAVALGLLAAVRLSGLESLAKTVEDVLAPRPVRADPVRAWEAMSRDKKARGGSPRLVLLEARGEPITGVELPEGQVRAALEALIAR